MLSIECERTLNIAGFDLTVDMNDEGGQHYHVSNEWKKRTCVHKPNEELWEAIQREYRPSLALDIGANYGFMSLVFARYFPDAEIFAVEPDPIVACYLKRNLEGATPCTRIFVAICGREKTERHSFARNLRSSLDNRVYPGGVSSGEWLISQVPSVCIDSLLSSADDERFVFVKINTRGYEERVIAGAERLLASNRWLAYMEFAPHLLRCHDTPPVEFLATLAGRFDVAEVPAHIPFGATLDDCFRRPLAVSDAAAFVSYVQSDGRMGFCKLLMRNSGR